MSIDLSAKIPVTVLIKCTSVRGSRYLQPEKVLEIDESKEVQTADSDYAIIRALYLGGKLADSLVTAGILVRTKGGLKMPRTPHPAKRVYPARNNKVFVRSTVNLPEWILFTKRTANPKLKWLLDECRKSKLRVFRQGRSFHAPCTYVHREDEEAAWNILTPVDDMADDHPKFR